MKIKLTEEQYNRLLVENDKSFLQGKVEFPHIGNEVNKFIVKLFNYIYEKKGRYINSHEREIIQIMVRDFGLTRPEAKLLTHNYGIFSGNGEETEFSKFLGEPLEFWGEFQYNTRIPVSAYMSGTLDGFITGHASSKEEFIDQLENNTWEDIDSDWSDDIEYFSGDAEWDIDTDYAGDRLRDEIVDLKRHGAENEIMDNIEIR